MNFWALIAFLLAGLIGFWFGKKAPRPVRDKSWRRVYESNLDDVISSDDYELIRRLAALPPQGRSTASAANAANSSAERPSNVRLCQESGGKSRRIHSDRGVVLRIRGFQQAAEIKVPPIEPPNGTSGNSIQPGDSSGKS